MPRKKTTLVEEIETKEESSVAAAEVEEPVVVEEKIEKPFKAEDKLYGIVACPFLNMREEPNAGSRIISLLSAGTKVEITGRVINGFYPIIDSSNPEYKVAGFAMEKYIAVD